MLRIKTFLKHKLLDKDDQASRVFGVALDPNASEIPSFIIVVLNRLRQSVDEQGLFRISGDHNEINALKKEFDDGHEVDLALQQTHTVASLFKLYLREMPAPLIEYNIGYDIYDGLIATYSIEETQLKHQLIKRLVMTLPDYSRAVLEYICNFLHFVEQNNVKNKMTSSNLAIVFAPNLMRPRVETLNVIIHDAPHIQYVVRALIQDCAFFFKKEPQPFPSSTPTPTSPSGKIILSNMRRSAPSPLSSPDLSSTLASMSASPSPPSPPSPPSNPQQKSFLLDPTANGLSSEEVKDEKPVDIVAQIHEMLILAESSIRNQLLPAIDEIAGKMQTTSDLDQATMLAECIHKARKLLNEGPTQGGRNGTNGESNVTSYADNSNPVFANERLQGIKASVETTIANIKTDLLALLNEAASIPDNCRQLEAEIALGQMIYIIQLLRNIKQVLFYKESTNRVFRIRSISNETVRTLKFAALITTMMTIINVIRERIDKQTSSVLLYAARAAANINSLLQAPLGSLDTSVVPTGPVLDTSDNQDAQSSLVELVGAILKEVEKGIAQFAHVIDRPDWKKSKDAWHTRASEILVVLESLVVRIDPLYPLELISNNVNTSPPLVTLSPRTRARAAPTPSLKLTPSATRPPPSDELLNPPELVAKGASLTTVFTSVSRTSKKSPPVHSASVPTLANARMVKSPSYKPPSSSDSSAPAPPSSPTRMIRSPSCAPTASSPISSFTPTFTNPPSPAFPRTAPSPSSPISHRLSTNTYNHSKIVIGNGTDPAKRGPNYELLCETVRQATAKFEGLVARARETVMTCNDVQIALRIVGSLRVVYEMMASTFGPSPTPLVSPTSSSSSVPSSATPPPAPSPLPPTYAFLKSTAEELSAEIALQLKIVKEWSAGGEEGLFKIAKTLRNIINALQVEPPSKK